MTAQDMATWQVLSWVIPGEPVAKGRPRFGHNGRVYTPERTKNFEHAVCATILLGRYAAAPLDGPLRLQVRFHVGKVRGRADLTNYVKAVEDAINLAQVVWRDDSQVVRLDAELYRNDPNPRTEITIESLTREEDPTR